MTTAVFPENSAVASFGAISNAGIGADAVRIVMVRLPSGATTRPAADRSGEQIIFISPEEILNGGKRSTILFDINLS